MWQVQHIKYRYALQALNSFVNPTASPTMVAMFLDLKIIYLLRCIKSVCHDQGLGGPHETLNFNIPFNEDFAHVTSTWCKWQ